jgi:hypothetical protein
MIDGTTDRQQIEEFVDRVTDRDVDLSLQEIAAIVHEHRDIRD